MTRIPDRYRLGLAKINALSIEGASAISVALAELPIGSGRREMIAAIGRAAQLTAEDAEAVIASLRSLYIFKASTESTVSDFIPVLISAMQSSGNKGLAVPDDDKPILIAKLTQLLSLSSMERTSKIEQLKTDHQVVFYDAKILTDLRPVFDDPKERPIGAVVTHTLKITCHEYGEHKELYFALDADDIATIKKISERAADKLSSIQDFMKSANLPDFS